MMRKVKIITDSCSDLNGEQLSKYNIDYVKMTTVFEGIETPAKLTWTAKEAHDFYNVMRNGNRINTSQVSMEEFQKVFEKYLKQEMDIVYIGCASKQSGSVNMGHVTARKLMEEYPGSTISCIDALNASIGEGMLAIEAAKLAKEEKSADEITKYIMSIRKTVQEFATVHSLDALKRAGRVSASSAFFGNLMGVKPILVADANGAQAAFKKVKGRQTSLQEIVKLLKENIIDPENQTGDIAHADCSQSEVDQLSEIVKNEIGCKDVSVGYIGPIVGASIGPDAIGVWAFGKEVTFKAEEK